MCKISCFFYLIMFTLISSCNGKVAPHDLGINDSVLNSDITPDTLSNQEISEENPQAPEYETGQEIVEENIQKPAYKTEEVERCNECNKELPVPPSNRTCYMCNGDFSGWGFVKYSESSGTIFLDSEVQEFPIIGGGCMESFAVHNNKRFNMFDDACCSRKCAVLLTSSH